MRTILIAAAMAVTAVVPASTQQVAVPVSQGDLDAVAALSDTDAWAVGYRLTGETSLTQVALHWDGRTWSQQGPLAAQSFPQSISARSDTDVWIAGGDVEHFDGTTWAVRRPADRMSANAIASTADGHAWVVGMTMQGGIKTNVPAAQSWNGTTWVAQQLPAIGYGSLTSVAAVSATDVWAAGFVQGTKETPLVLHWDGVTWSQVPVPGVPGRHTWLGGVTALSTNDVWAVGGSLDRPFAVQWNGHAWTVAPTPGSPTGRLLGVARTGDGQLWAYGPSSLLRWQDGRWRPARDPGMTVRSGAVAPGGKSLWLVGLSTRGDMVPATTRIGG